MASAKGLPSESRHTAHRSPGGLPTHQLTDAFECHGQVGDGEVREGSGIPRTGPTLVDPEAEAVGVDLPPGSGPGGSRGKVNPEHCTPEAVGASGVVGREFDPGCGHEDQYGRQVARHLTAGDVRLPKVGLPAEPRVYGRVNSTAQANCKGRRSSGFPSARPRQGGSTLNAPQQPAGWYPDPQSPGQRYWDGVQWTEHRTPGQQKSNTSRNVLIAGLVTLGVLVVGVIGCAALVSTSTTTDEPQVETGENSGGSSERGIPGAEQTVKSYLAAFSRADGEAACGFYSRRPTRRSSSGGTPRRAPARSCPELVRKVHARLEQAGGLSFEGTTLTPSVVRNLDLKPLCGSPQGTATARLSKAPRDSRSSS